MIQPLLNAMRVQAMLASNDRVSTRVGTVSGYDSNNYCAKVKIQPQGIETGWLPVASPWIGNGWGMFAPPSIDDPVEIQFLHGNINAGVVCLRFYGDQLRPLNVASGEFWIVHKSGSALKFHNDGSVDLVSNQNLNVTVGGNLTANVTGNASLTVSGNITSQATAWTHTGPITVTGLLTAQNGIAMSSGTASFSGNTSINGTLTNNGKSVGSVHTHNEHDGYTTTVPN